MSAPYKILYQGGPSGKYKSLVTKEEAENLVKRAGPLYSYVPTDIESEARKEQTFTEFDEQVKRIVDRRIREEVEKRLKNTSAEESIESQVAAATEQAIDHRVNSRVSSYEVQGRIEKAVALRTEVAVAELINRRQPNEMQIRDAAEKRWEEYLENRIACQFREIRAAKEEQSKLYEKARRIRVLKGKHTDTPCHADCWEAMGEVCQCSCGGENHSIAFDPERLEEYQRLKKKESLAE